MDLVRGQRTKLEALTPETVFDVTVDVKGLDSADLKFLCLVLDAGDGVLDEQAIVHTPGGRTSCGGVVVKERGVGTQTFTVDLSKLPTNTAKVSFALVIHAPNRPVPLHAEAIREGHVSLTAGGRTVARYAFQGSDFGKEAALQLIEVYRKGVWRLAVVGAGYVGGLPALLSRYRLSLDAIPSGGPGRDPLPPQTKADRVRLPADWAGGQMPSLPGGLTRAVGLVVVELADGRTATGTGFVINPGGFVLTCHHVIDGARRVSFSPEGAGHLRPAEVVRSDPDCDMALLWIADRHGAPDWMLLAGPDAQPDLGTELGLLGYPLGFDLGLSVTYSQGIINSVRRKGELPVLQVDAGAAPGSSGGPVFRRADGRVVGMLTSGLDLAGRGMLINFAIDIRAVWRLDWLDAG